MTSIEELKDLAAQLRQPQGKKGVEISDNMNETNIKMTLHSIDRLKILQGQKILELGHGNCGHLPYLLKQKAELSYYGLEMSDLMKEEAENRNKIFIDAKQASFHLYNGENIPFTADIFDRIFTVNTIYFWTKPQFLLSELYRILKPEGLLSITFAQKSFMENLPFAQFGFELYDDQKIEKLAATTAFKILGSNTQTETITSKTGDVVNRSFTTVSLEK